MKLICSYLQKSQILAESKNVKFENQTLSLSMLPSQCFTRSSSLHALRRKPKMAPVQQQGLLLSSPTALRRVQLQRPASVPGESRRGQAGHCCGPFPGKALREALKFSVQSHRIYCMRLQASRGLQARLACAASAHKRQGRGALSMPWLLAFQGMVASRRN